MPFSKTFKGIWKAAASLTGRRPTLPPPSYEQALAIFDSFANREDLAFGHPLDGCFARCHIICADTLKMGYVPQKAWAVHQEQKRYFRFKMPSGERIRYWYHTAMVLAVRTPNNNLHELVFDPALLDGPVGLHEWGQTINAPSYYLEIKRLGKPPMNYIGDYNTKLTTTQAIANPSEDYYPWNEITRCQKLEVTPRTVFPSQYCRDILFPAIGQWPERQGKGWISTDPHPKPPTHPTPPRQPGNPFGGPQTGG